jgi:hypothetical protein
LQRPPGWLRLLPCARSLRKTRTQRSSPPRVVAPPSRKPKPQRLLLPSSILMGLSSSTRLRPTDLGDAAADARGCRWVARARCYGRSLPELWWTGASAAATRGGSGGDWLQGLRWLLQGVFTAPTSGSE